MTPPSERRGTAGSSAARRRAGVVAVLLLLAGSLLGVFVDRMWLLPSPQADTLPLTAEAMAVRLDLDPAEQGRIRALLDTMHAELTAAATQGPDALLATARRGHERLEDALPPEAVPEFRAWMREHHRQLMERMHGDRAHERTHGGAEEAEER